MPTAIILGCVALLFALAVVAAGSARKRWAGVAVYGIGLAASVVAFAAALAYLLGGAAPAPALHLPFGLPWLGAHFRMDALAAFFLAVVNLGGAAACLYALGYGRHEPAPQRVLPFFPAFLGAMNLVVLADDAFTFLFCWESMSLASWALVMAHHREGDNARAGYVYLVMASLGTLTLLLAFGLLAGPGGGYGFGDIRAAAPTSLSTALVVGLTLLGAGSKAGLIPLHVWLPLAHPAAPSHVSALMSGVMTKVAVYGFIRIAFDLAGEPAWWFSIPVMVVGATTAVLGILYACMQDDLKRLLAYSSIENIGFVFVGLGLALAFRANGMALAAAVALSAALFHVLNHALFKSLLFFGAGAVLTATGQRDLRRLGGLIHAMPATAVLFLVGAVAIAALPPLNGFVSEWMTLQAILHSPQLPQWGLKIAVPAVGAALALAAALAAACFVKVFGIAFLGRPRSLDAQDAGEVDRFSLAAMALLAGLCLLVGILPGLVIDGLAPVAQQLVGSRMPQQTAMPWLSIAPFAEARNAYNGLLVFLFIALSAAVAAVAIHRLASRAVRRAPAWDCGFPDPSPQTQYTAGSFVQPIRRIYGTHVFRVREWVEMPPPGDMRPARLRVDMRDLVWDGLYAPLARAVDRAGERLNALQFLTIRRYLSFVFLALVGLLAMLALWP